ncbi:MAG TPA: M1 family aminopeptidase [Bacteroidia bacterium]|nr:M1 family aminopeptidase [Bacteroidia bacterium]
MKKLILALSILSASLQAQHKFACAETKIKSHANANKTASMLATPYLINLENQYDLKFYHLNLSLSINNKVVSGNVHTLATVTSTALDSFAFELYSTYTIDSVLLNGNKIAVSRHGDEARVPFLTPAPQGSLIDATVYYHGTAPTINGPQAGDGYNNGTSPTWHNKSAYTLSECYHAYEWFPVKQQLHDKIDSTWVFVTTDSSNRVGSNGILTNVVPIGNQKRFEWKNNHPIDYYLISVALAQYIDYRIYAHPQGYPDSILIQNFIYNNPATLPYVKSIVDSTKNLVELFSQLYGLYPWADQKYGHCETVLGGGMEHQTMTTIGGFDFITVAHELGHQWFGDKVTCGTWHDIAMNEGFATYTEYLALEYLEPGQESPYMFNAHADIMSVYNGSVYNPDTTSENRIFDSRLSYEKGGAVLHTLRFVINNDSMFFLAYRNYLQQFDHSTGTIADFQTSVQNTTGLNLNQFFTQWFYGEGFPSFDVHWNQQGSNFTMRSIQTVSDASVTPLFITPIQYTLLRNIGDTTIRVMHQTDTAWYNFNVAGTVTGIIIDSANWIINDTIGITHDATLTGINTYKIIEETSVYPNPASTMVTIKSEGNFTFTLYDVTGKMVLSKKCNSIENMDVSRFASGMYFYQVSSQTAAGIKTGKLVIR